MLLAVNLHQTAFLLDELRTSANIAHVRVPIISQFYRSTITRAELYDVRCCNSSLQLMMSCALTAIPGSAGYFGRNTRKALNIAMKRVINNFWFTGVKNYSTHFFRLGDVGNRTEGQFEKLLRRSGRIIFT